MARTATPRPCIKACGRHVIGKGKICSECAPKCECGQRKRPDRTTCYACSPAGSERPIVWVPNGRGILVARRR